VHASGAWPLAQWLLPLLALVVGLGAQQVADPHRVNLVFGPFLLVLGFNLLVYLALAAHGLLRLARWLGRGGQAAAQPAGGGWLQAPARWLSRQRGGGLPARLLKPWLRFQADWLDHCSPALAARLKALMHLCAALLAIGMVLALYAGGLFLDYRVGWESTFLGPEQVRQFLSWLQAPWAWLPALHLTEPTLAQVEALRFELGGSLDSGAGPGAGQAAGSGALWVHLYAGMLLLGVVLPRLLLSGLARWQAARWARHVMLDLNQPYFVQLLGHHGGRQVQVQLLPFSMTPGPALARALVGWSQARYGEGASLQLGATLRDDSAPAAALAGLPRGPGQALVLLCSLASTPEPARHGALLKAARAHDASAHLLLDASGMAERMSSLAGGPARLREREHLWSDFCQAEGVALSLICLPDVALPPTPDGPLFVHPCWSPAPPDRPAT
ncbi:DUF2868 domain-containing protein, partial [Ideonella sp.]|uniref:DUF2868 domain-containing protein n=1 Tax=Ideonella sp. TaxID=1929293 RepID=UPI003BB5C43A